MKVWKYLLVLGGVLLFGCNEQEAQHGDGKDSVAVKEPAATHFEGGAGTEEYALITGVTEKGDLVIIDADYILYLTGEKAVEAAKKAHEADTTVTADGKQKITVPDGYFIVNDNKKLRHLSLSKSATFDLVISADRGRPIKDNSLESFKMIYKDSPFLLTVAGDEVTKVKEIFIP